VLLVEDNEGQALAIEHRMVAAGLRVTVLTGQFAAAGALLALEEDSVRFDIVVSDLHLGDAVPGIDGHSVCRAAVARGVFALLITSDTTVSMASVGERTRFVSKPITAQQIALIVREYEVEMQNRDVRERTLSLDHIRNKNSAPGVRTERDALLRVVDEMNCQFGVLTKEPPPPMTATPDTEPVVQQRLLHVARLQNEVLQIRLERAEEATLVCSRHVDRLSAVVRGAGLTVDVAARPRLFWGDAIVSDRSVIQMLSPPRTLEVLATAADPVYGVKLDGEIWVTFCNSEDRGRFTETLTRRFPGLETDRVVVDRFDWVCCASCHGMLHSSQVAAHTAVCHRL